MSIYFKCCAICGSISFWGLDEECHDCNNSEPLNTNEITPKHKALRIQTKPIYYYSQHKIDYYEKMSIQKYNNTEMWYDVFIQEELSVLPTFNLELYKAQEEKHKQYYINQRQNNGNDIDKKSYIIRMQSNSQQLEKTNKQPKCPTCQSTNIKKINVLERGLSATAFGLASSKIGKTMCCNNCGYKW